MATEQDNVNSGALGTLVAVGTIAFLGIALVVTALVRAELSEEVEKKEVSADRAYRDLVAEQQAKLNAPAAYSDRARGLVALPIDKAMELTVASLAKDPNSATPPPPIGGSGGSGGAGAGGADAAAGGVGGTGGTGGADGTGGTAGGVAEEEKAPAEEPNKEAPKKAAPKPAPAPKAAPGAPGSPGAPAPVMPAPAPAAPSPAPNGQ